MSRHFTMICNIYFKNLNIASILNIIKYMETIFIFFKYNISCGQFPSDRLLSVLREHQSLQALEGLLSLCNYYVVHRLFKCVPYIKNIISWSRYTRKPKFICINKVLRPSACKFSRNAWMLDRITCKTLIPNFTQIV
jgi:hypothetical protein